MGVWPFHKWDKVTIMVRRRLILEVETNDQPDLGIRFSLHISQLK